MNERSRCTEEVFARLGEGPQRFRITQEVTQNLIHELLGQILPSCTSEPFRDVVDPPLHTARCERYPQAGGIS